MIFKIKAYSKKQLIEELGISSAYQFDKIVKPHAEKIGKRMGHYYTPKQVRLILDLVQTYKKSETMNRKFKITKR